jgi:hypothetical protein
MFPINTIRHPVFSTIYAGTLPAPAPAVLTIVPNRSPPSHDHVLITGILSEKSFMGTGLWDWSWIEGTASYFPCVRMPEAGIYMQGR